MNTRALFVLAISLGLASCTNERPEAVPASPLPSAADSPSEIENPFAAPPEPSDDPLVGLALDEDVEPRRSEQQSGAHWRYTLEYPEALEALPRLLAAMRDFVEPAFAEFRAAVEALPVREPADLLYEFSIVWTLAARTPTLASIVAEGYQYTGGAHGMPVLAALHLAVDRDELLEPTLLMEDADGWQRLSELARERLREDTLLRLEEAPPEERQAALELAMDWIREGTRPEPALLSLFEPVTDLHGRVVGIKLLFPPYQVSSYAEGPREAHVGLPEIAEGLSAAWRQAFGLEPR